MGVNIGWLEGQMGIVESVLCWLLPFRDIVKDGNLYLRRFYLSPSIFGRRIYLHHIMRSDEDRHPHDHPWSFFTMMLWGRYTEHFYTYCGDVTVMRSRVLKPFRTLFRRATDTHRLFLSHGPCWTFVVRGKQTREWGFATESGWMHWKQYLRLNCGA